MKIEENIKIKNLLKGLFENQEHETSFEEELISWNDNESIYERKPFAIYCAYPFWRP